MQCGFLLVPIASTPENIALPIEDIEKTSHSVRVPFGVPPGGVHLLPFSRTIGHRVELSVKIDSVWVALISHDHLSPTGVHITRMSSKRGMRTFAASASECPLCVQNGHSPAYELLAP